MLVNAFGLWLDSEPAPDPFGAPDAVRAAKWHADPPENEPTNFTAVPDDPHAAILFATRKLGCATKFLWPIADRGLRRRLSLIEAPTLVVHGSSDGLLPNSYGGRVDQLVEPGRVKTLEGLFSAATNDVTFYPVRTEPVDIEGLAGPVVVTVNSFTGKQSITVGGQPAARIRRWTYGLPTTGGSTVTARVQASLMDPYPVITIAGVKHRAGPSVPLVLRVLALLPIVLVGFGGAIGGAIGFIGVAGNLAILRGGRPNAVNGVLMIVVLAAAVVAWIIVAAVIASTIS